jgi:hypothetical protein
VTDTRNPPLIPTNNFIRRGVCRRNIVSFGTIPNEKSGEDESLDEWFERNLNKRRE